MDQSVRHEVKYQESRCQFLDRQVWAILSKQSDASWKVVNCLDKYESCFEQDCVFTKDGGEWPFKSIQVSSKEG